MKQVSVVGPLLIAGGLMAMSPQAHAGEWSWDWDTTQAVQPVGEKRTHVAGDAALSTDPRDSVVPWDSNFSSYNYAQVYSSKMGGFADNSGELKVSYHWVRNKIEVDGNQVDDPEDKPPPYIVVEFTATVWPLIYHEFNEGQFWKVRMGDEEWSGNGNNPYTNRSENKIYAVVATHNQDIVVVPPLVLSAKAAISGAGSMMAWVTASARRVPRFVYVSSGIEASYKKHVGVLPSTHQEKVNNVMLPNPAKATLVYDDADDAKDVWRIACLRKGNGSMTVESVARLTGPIAPISPSPTVTPTPVPQWAGDTTYTANNVGVKNPKYEWDFDHTPYSNIGPASDSDYTSQSVSPLFLLTPDATALPLSSQVSVTVTDLDPGMPSTPLTNTYTVNWHLPYEKQNVLPSLLASYSSGITYSVPTYGQITIQEEQPATIDVSAGFEGLAGAIGAFAGGPPGALAGYGAAASIAQGLSGTFDLTWTIDGSLEYTFVNGDDNWTQVGVNNPGNVSHPTWLSDPNGFARFDVTMKRMTRWERKRWNCDEYDTNGFVGPDRVLAKDLRPKTQFEPFYILKPGQPVAPPNPTTPPTGGSNP